MERMRCHAQFSVWSHTTHMRGSQPVRKSDDVDYVKSVSASFCGSSRLHGVAALANMVHIGQQTLVSHDFFLIAPSSKLNFSIAAETVTEIQIKLTN